MNIVVCGYKGTGKTTLCKRIAGELGFEYVLHYQICKDPQQEPTKILEFLKRGDGYVLDLLAPFNAQALAGLDHTFCIFMGFEKAGEKALVGIDKMTDKQAKDIISKSAKLKKMCTIYGLPFFGVGADRESAISEAFELAKDKTLKIQ